MLLVSAPNHPRCAGAAAGILSTLAWPANQHQQRANGPRARKLHLPGVTRHEARRDKALQCRRKPALVMRDFSQSTAAPAGTTAVFASSDGSAQQPGHTAPRAVTEDAVTTVTEGNLDPINALLAHPALFEPVRKPRNPIVLCHGLYGFDTWGLEILPALRIHYWAEILTILKGIVGVDPIITGVPGTGSIENRAAALHKSLQKEVSGKAVNLIGHSMGGLDCRHLLTHIKPTEYTPLSLTTLATPHRGSHFMEWCRANIGIGGIAKAAAAASDKKGSKNPLSVDSASLPYSLKTPLLTRKQEEAAAKAAEAAEKTKERARKAAHTLSQINLPGLNYSLGTSLASYLLDLLDSPAYSNLTPEFLNETFNPSTPDRPDVRYFSVAARTPKLPITHPLWLPKVILDKMEEIEKQSDIQNGVKHPEDWQWGNDGLVPVYSAKWGEYLGCVDNCDHWTIRGGSGLYPDPKSKKSTTSGPAVEESKSSASSSASGGGIFGWQDVNLAVGTQIGAGDSKLNPKTDDEGQSTSKSSTGKDPFATLSSIAGWIAKRIPLPGNNARSLKSSISPSFPLDDTVPAVGDANPSNRNRDTSMDGARLLFGSQAKTPTPQAAAKKAKFDRERFYVALCQKLYDEGL